MYVYTAMAQETAEKLGASPDAGSVFALTPTALLAAMVRGEIDPRELAREELAARGMDERARWIGFEAAREKFHCARA